MDFLGHEVSAEGLRPNANKVKAINAMPTPTDPYDPYANKIADGSGRRSIEKN
jgi:hypothetical protein